MKRIDIPNKHWGSSFKFSFVRNPYSRVVSAWADKFDTNIPFPTFVKEHLTTYDSMNSLHNFSTEKDAMVIHHISALLNPKYFIKELDFIGKFESLQQDFDMLCDKIGIPVQTLPHVNKSNHKPYTEHYDEESRRIVSQKYKDDIDYFGYSFGD